MGLLVLGRGVGRGSRVEVGGEGRGRDLGGVVGADMVVVVEDMEVLEGEGGMEGRMAMVADTGGEVAVEGEVVGVGEEGCIMDVWEGRACRVGSGEGGRGYRRGLGGGAGMDGGEGGEVGIEIPGHQQDRRKKRARISTQK